MMIDKSMVTRKSWEEFRQNGLLWFTNLILHMFGWSIVVKQDNNIIVDVYPARVKYRGFSEKTNTEGYKKVSKYLQENINELVKESDESMIREDIPRNKCIHNKVCNVRKQFEETEVKTTHPYIIVKLECTEFYKDIVKR